MAHFWIKTVGRYDGHCNFFLTNNTYYNEPGGHCVWGTMLYKCLLLFFITE